MTGAKYNPDVHRRRSVRLKGYDYSQVGAYFVTLCTWHRECLFGEIADGLMEVNEFGHVVLVEWTKTLSIRREIELDEFCVMPNHVHGIVILLGDFPDVGANGCSPGTEVDEKTEGGRSAESPIRMRSRSIASFIAGFKSAVTKAINESRNAPGLPVWQRNYYEHIIRNDSDLKRIREYIGNNPARWADDEENPENVRTLRLP